MAIRTRRIGIRGRSRRRNEVALGLRPHDFNSSQTVEPCRCATGQQFQCAINLTVKNEREYRMKTNTHAAPRFALSALVLFASLSLGLAAPQVTTLRTPDGGIQPQAVVDSQGVIHLIYYKGDAGDGDIFYVHQASGQGA